MSKGEYNYLAIHFSNVISAESPFPEGLTHEVRATKFANMLGQLSDQYNEPFSKTYTYSRSTSFLGNGKQKEVKRRS